MQIKVRYFAVFRERIGREEEVLALDSPATAGDAISSLESRHDAVLALRGRYRYAVNQEFCEADHLLQAGDELALIPPVAGGSSDNYVRIVDSELSLDRVTAKVRRPQAGALVTFTGIVRDHSQGKSVERLEYEAYTEMAEKTIRELCEELRSAEPELRISIEHRVGKLEIGDLAVVIAVSAPHRAEAFQFCRAAIDGLKERAPIWKKEFATDGASWVGLGP